MITVENLLDAYAIAFDLWSDPELAILENGHPRENPTPEYATLIRKAVSAENAKLREERDMYRDLVGLMDHPDLNVQLQAENAKLRELVRDMWRFTGAACKKYPRLFDPSAAGGQMVQLNALDSFEQRMHELGVEVMGE